jgi:hypothetical protein
VPPTLKSPLCSPLERKIAVIRFDSGDDVIGSSMADVESALIEGLGDV